MTASEEFVFNMCNNSFLPFWSHPNPLGKKNKELCDVLLVCGNDIVIISVKDIQVSEHSDKEIVYERWVKKAIRNSVDQIYGAERYLRSCEDVFLSDGKTKIRLPPLAERNIYRIAIAFGSDPDFPLETGDFGNGYVHVFDEESTEIIIAELDTFSDFIDYLKAKEKLTKNTKILADKEVNFLAAYLQTGLEFDIEPDTLAIDTELWEDFIKSPDYEEWKCDVEDSRIWDKMIQQLFERSKTEDDIDRTILESTTRKINLERRINRIELAKILRVVLETRMKGRIVMPQPGMEHAYMFMAVRDNNFHRKETELKFRCMVARKIAGVKEIIGISLWRDETGELIFDIMNFYLEKMDSQFLEMVIGMQRDLRLFVNTQMIHNDGTPL